MKKNILILLIFFSFILIFSDGLYMNSPFNTGANALNYNPAFLSRKDIPWFSFDLWRINLGFSNDLISPSFTKYLFPNSSVSILESGFNADTLGNDTINEEKKQSILRSIGDYFYFELPISIAFLPINMKIGNFAFSTKTINGQLLQLPHDLFELMLYGNEFDRIYDFNDLYFHTETYEKISTGFSFAIPVMDESHIHIGLGMSYLAGIGYFEMEVDSFANFESDSNYLRQSMYMNIKYGLPIAFDMGRAANEDGYMDSVFDPNSFDIANIGKGFDLNVGMVFEFNDRLLFEGMFEHAISRIYWNQGCSGEYLLRFRTDSMSIAHIYNVYNLVNDSLTEDSLDLDLLSEIIQDSLIFDSIITVSDQLTSSLQPQMHFGLMYRMQYLPLDVFLRYTQGFKNTAFTSIYPKFITGVQYTIWNWALLESAFAFGGREAFQFNIGLGLNFPVFSSDINFSQDRGLLNAQKGMHLSLNACFHSSLYGTFIGTVIDSTTEEPMIAKITIRRNNSKKVDSLQTDLLGKFTKKYNRTKISIMITAENYDTIIDSTDLMTGDRIERLYKMAPSQGRLLVKVIDGITKKIIKNAKVIFGKDTLFTDSTGTVQQYLEDGEHVIVVKANKKQDVVFPIEIERGKEYSKLVEMMPIYGKIQVRTFNASNNKPVKSAIIVMSSDMKTKLDSFVTDSMGIGRSKGIKKGDYNLHIVPLVKKYIKQDKFGVNIRGGYLTKVDVGLLKEKMVFVFNNILFDYNKANLKPASYPVCDSLAQIMKENPSIKVEISGHTDSKGSRSYNKRLSQSRAESVRNYLIKKHGIKAKRIIAVGYGEDRLLISPERTPDDYQRNRRVEFKVLQSK